MGTKTSAVEPILNRGLDERFTSAAAFGSGAYLADDPSKADQYAWLDSATVAEADLKHLHQNLYGVDEPPFEEDVHYMFVCRTLLGYPIYTKGPATPEMPRSVIGPTPSCGPGLEVFANRSMRQLTKVPGTSCLYHSLIAMKGEDSVVKRHQEFVLCDGKAIL